MLLAAACSGRWGYGELGDCRGLACVVDESDSRGVAADAEVGSSGPSDGSVVDGADPSDAGGAPHPLDGAASPGDSNDGSLPTAPDGAPRCGSLALLADDFEPTPDPIWYSATRGGAEAVPVAGRLELRVARDDAEASYRTHVSHDFRGAALAAELLAVGGRTSGIQLFDGRSYDRFGEPVGAQRSISLRVTQGVLEAVRADVEGEQVLATAAYDAAVHRHVRLREQGEQVFWETSPDRADWSTLHRAPLSIDASSAYVALFASGAGESRVAAFDRVNEARVDVPGYCSPGALRDDFASPELGPQWIPWNGAGSCTVAPRAGRAELRFEGGFAACALKANRFVSLGDASLAVEFVEVPERTGFTTRVELLSLDLVHGLELLLTERRATMRVKRMGTITFETSANYDTSPPRFWRLGEAAGRTYWEASSDGLSYRREAEGETTFAGAALWFSVWGLASAQQREPVLLRIERIDAP